MAEYLKRADIQEAANVAADLLAIENKMPLTENSLKVPEAAATPAAAASAAVSGGTAEASKKTR